MVKRKRPQNMTSLQYRRICYQYKSICAKSQTAPDLDSLQFQHFLAKRNSGGPIARQELTTTTSTLGTHPTPQVIFTPENTEIPMETIQTGSEEEQSSEEQEQSSEEEVFPQSRALDLDDLVESDVEGGLEDRGTPEEQLLEKLGNWYYENNVTQKALNGIIEIMREHLGASLPKDARTVLDRITKRDDQSEVVEESENTLYFGIRRNLVSLLEVDTVGDIGLHFNIDGLPISGNSCFFKKNQKITPENTKKYYTKNHPK